MSEQITSLERQILIKLLAFNTLAVNCIIESMIVTIENTTPQGGAILDIRLLSIPSHGLRASRTSSSFCTASQPSMQKSIRPKLMRGIFQGL